MQCSGLVFFILLLSLLAQHASAAAAQPEEKAPLSLLSLPVAAQGAISARLGRDEVAYHARLRGSGLAAENREHGYTIEFGPQGPELMAGSGRLKLALAGVGYGAQLQAVERVSPKTQVNQVEYPRRVLSEWYVNGPLGLEQGFTLKHRPAGSQAGPLTLALDLSGTLEPALDGNTLTLSAPRGGAVLHYRGLTALDARGRELPARLALTGGTLKIEVEERNAIYPITIDPFIEQAKLTASDGAPLGRSVALSADGRTALVGSDNAVYVFVRKRTGLWIEQQKLTASDATAFQDFGISVALSADGKTALIGASSADDAAYVFVRKGNKWVEQQKLTASDAAAGGDFGWSVALSAGGKTALIGAIFAGCPAGEACGAAYVFVRHQGIWVEQQKLTASDVQAGNLFGNSVALSVGGKTVLIGARNDFCPTVDLMICGAAYVFVRHQGIWVEQQKLTASDGAAGGGNFGSSVALSAGGKTLLIGDSDAECRPAVDGECGAAYVFVRKKSGMWVEQQKLIVSDPELGAFFGESVALSVGGKTALVGSPSAGVFGAAYIFHK